MPQPVRLLTKLNKLNKPLRLLLALCSGTLAASSCELKAPSLGTGRSDAGSDLPTLDVKATLHSLFPSLSDKELSDASGKLGLSAALALRTELTEARKSVAKFSEDLFKTAGERVSERNDALRDHNDGYPEGVAALGALCSYREADKRAQIQLSGVFKDHDAVALQASQLQLRVDGKAQDFDLSCLAGGPSVDIVFLIDITGSMSNVIAAVRDSVISFVDRLQDSKVRGSVSVVTFQDSVGVNRSFQEPAPANNYERSPFFAPVDLQRTGDVDALRAFVNRLEANRGDDAPENLTGAIDFARNNVIGYTTKGEPNVIGDGKEDPAGTSAFPELSSERQVFVALTDITFHGDDRDASNSSLLKPFVPRRAQDVLTTLQGTGSVVHVSDPSWVDEGTDPKRDPVDADYWAIGTGGVGRDTVEGYSLVDLELVVVAKSSGLLDINLDKIIQSSCTLSFDAELSATAQVELSIDVAGATDTQRLNVIRL